MKGKTRFNVCFESGIFFFLFPNVC